MTRRLYLVLSERGAIAQRRPMRVFLPNGQEVRNVASIQSHDGRFGSTPVVTLTLTDTKFITTTVPPKRRTRK